jgi:hypothetical protein
MGRSLLKKELLKNWSSEPQGKLYRIYNFFFGQDLHFSDWLIFLDKKIKMPIMKKLILLIALIIPVHLFSQSWQWASSRPFASHPTRTNIVITDVYGNSYMAGSKNAGLTDNHFICKYDPNGNLLWENLGNGNPGAMISIATDHSGNLYAQLFSPIFNGVSYNHSDGTLFLKFSPGGGVIWLKRSQCRMLFAERTSNNDDLICTGAFLDTVDLGNSHFLNGSELNSKNFMAIYTTDGDCFWSQQDDGGNYALQINDQGAMLAKAEVQWGTTVGQGSSQQTLSPSNGGTYHAKYDSVGNLIWVKQLNTTLAAADNYGNAYIYKSGQIAKYDPLGNLLWERTNIYSPSLYKAVMKCNSSGDIFLTGGFSNSLTIGDTTITVSGTKAFVAKIDSAGTLQWVTVSSGTGAAIGKDITIADDGAILITGDMGSGTSYFGPHAVTQSAGVFVAKLLDVDVTGISEKEKEQSLQLYPNPSGGTFSISYKGKTEEKLILAICNSRGQLIWKSVENNTGAEFRKEVDLSSSPKGIYFLHLRSDEGVLVKKIVLQ